MDIINSDHNCLQRLNINLVSGLIGRIQRKSGEIPWYNKSQSDPWNHIEAAMGLGIGGHLNEAFKAFLWLKKVQNLDGSWYTCYFKGIPKKYIRETNMSAYIAVGVFQYWLITNDYAFLNLMWSSVCKAINFVINFQGIYGEIFWAISSKGKIDPKALLTGSSCIFMSLKCAIAIANELGLEKKKWNHALFRLKNALKHQRFLFDSSKKRFSMDWFYPILSGAISGNMALSRIRKYWDQFVVENLGVRCVSDKPWITIAETSELILTLVAIEKRGLARTLFKWISRYRFLDNSLWCGFTFPNNEIWPTEKITWTNAVFLMAIDSLYCLTPAHNMFVHSWWKKKYDIKRI